MSYGISPYGISSYGAAVADLSIVSAVAISTRTVRVVLTEEPQNILRSLPGDAYNPSSWSIVRGDTNEGFNILEITRVDATTWDIRTIEAFGSVTVIHTVSSASLVDVGGSPIDLPRSATFRGTIDSTRSTPARKATRRRQGIRDFNNPPAPAGLNSLSSTLVMDAAGDYQLHEGSELVRKLIYRRITTTPGAFWHLPDYGAGIKVKQPLPPARLIQLRAELERQVSLEPEVDFAVVRVTQNKNALNIQIKARLLSTGQQVSFPIKLPYGVQF